MAEASLGGPVVLEAWIKLFFDGAKTRWPQLTRKQFDTAMENIWKEKSELSIQEMNDLLEPEMEKLFA